MKRDEVTMTNHSVMRYIERFNPNWIDQAKAEIKRIAKQGQEVKPLDGAVSLMNNHYAKMKYVRYQDAVAAISENNDVKTVLQVKGKGHWIDVKTINHG